MFAIDWCPTRNGAPGALNGYCPSCGKLLARRRIIAAPAGLVAQGLAGPQDREEFLLLEGIFEYDGSAWTATRRPDHNYGLRGQEVSHPRTAPFHSGIADLRPDEPTVPHEFFLHVGSAGAIVTRDFGRPGQIIRCPGRYSHRRCSTTVLLTSPSNK